MPFQSEPTLVPGIVLSDLSIVEQNTGKRSIIGSFDQLVFPQFPATYGRFFVTAWIANIAGTFDEMELTCRIEDKASAHVIFSTSTKIQFPAQQTFDNSAILALSTAVMGAVFQRAALYTIVLLLNGEETGRRDFNIRLAQRPSPPQIQPPQQ
jgi:hypothetical protein